MVITIAYIGLKKFRLHLFHFFYSLGFLSGALAGFALASFLHRDVRIVGLLCTAGAGCFFGLVALERRLSGRENIVYYHHEIGILFTSWILLLLLRQPPLVYLDITIVGIGIFNVFSRCGCFFVGCCHGKPSPFGVRYNHRHVQNGLPFYYENITLFPIQLTESAGALLTVGGCIFMMASPGYQPGEVLVFYSLAYGCLRFALEYFRGDAERAYWYGLSEAQWTSVFIMLLCTGLGALGVLPLHDWHFILSGLLLLMAIAVFLFSRFDRAHRFFNPLHVYELATALRSMKAANANGSSVQPVSFFVTAVGLKVSHSCIEDASHTEHFYMLTHPRHPSGFSKRTVQRLARLVRFLNGHERCEIGEGARGACCLIYSDKKQTA